MDSAGETGSESEWKVPTRNFISNATTRNIIDLLLVLVILVLLTVAAPVIRGDCNNNGDKIEIRGQESSPQVSSCNNRCCGECSCQTGFTGNHPDCADVDECNLGNNACQANSNCVNTIGSYRCE